MKSLEQLLVVGAIGLAGYFFYKFQVQKESVGQQPVTTGTDSGHMFEYEEGGRSYTIDKSGIGYKDDKLSVEIGTDTLVNAWTDTSNILFGNDKASVRDEAKTNAEAGLSDFDISI